MHDLTEIPAEDFPLHWNEYSRLMDELQDAGKGFLALGQKGWPDAKEIDAQLMKARHQLYIAWNMIAESERKLKASMRPQNSGR